jgi:Mitochondrial K+-H+ exchange-related
MDVYVIPVASDRYELYCEPVEERTDGHEEPSGWMAVKLERFQVRVSRIDLQYVTQPHAGNPETWRQQMRGRVMRWIAEKAAEQRLLWRLRRHSAARVFYPADLSQPQAATIVRRLLQRDTDRHRTWMIFHAVALVVATVVLGPIFLLIPGIANLPALYFGFRLVGHYLSMRGARHALKDVVWTYEECGPLLGLRQVLTSSPEEWAHRVEEISSRLQLPHLPRFFRQTADWGVL